jgi:hypothetical protein
MLLDILGVSHQNKMLIRVYMPAIACLILSVLMQEIGNQAYENLIGTKYLPDFAGTIYTVFAWISVILLCASGLAITISSYQLWKWEKGEALETCHICGGMVLEKSGRFGLYYKCLACESTHSER